MAKMIESFHHCLHGEHKRMMAYKMPKLAKVVQVHPNLTHVWLGDISDIAAEYTEAHGCQVVLRQLMKRCYELD